MATNNSANIKNTGIQSLTSAGVLSGVTVTGTTNQITISNGDGTAGNPTVALASTVINGTQPLFKAVLQNDVTNATGDGTQYTLICGGSLFDQASNYNTGTGVFTAPATGKYRFEGVVTLSNLGASHTSCSIVFGNTSRNYGMVSCNPYASSDAAQIYRVSFCTIMLMNATDVTSIVITVSGSTKTVTVAAGLTSNRITSFSGQLIGT